MIPRCPDEVGGGVAWLGEGESGMVIRDAKRQGRVQGGWVERTTLPLAKEKETIQENKKEERRKGEKEKRRKGRKGKEKRKRRKKGNKERKNTEYLDYNENG